MQIPKLSSLGLLVATTILTTITGVTAIPLAPSEDFVNTSISTVVPAPDDTTSDILGWVPVHCDWRTGIDGAGKQFCVNICTSVYFRTNCGGSRCIARDGANALGQCYCTC